MRKIVASLFVTLDGVVEAPEKWASPAINEEIAALVGSTMAAGDTMLLGRITYQTFEAAFTGEKAGDPMAAKMTDTPKVVVSTTLDEVAWKNSTLIGGNVTEEIVKLKEQPGKNINISGSPTLVGRLVSLGLLDELNLIVFPVVLGGGRRLFEDGVQVALQLTGSQVFGNGVVHLAYAPADV
jgi:dihydrofolate reductase